MNGGREFSRVFYQKLIMKVILIGSGNTATVLGRKMLKAGHVIIQVMSSNQTHAATLAEELRCSYSDKLENISLQGDLYLLAVTDSALPDLSKQLRLENKIALHTAGSVPKNILQPVSKNFGVLYPLQTLHKEIKRNFDIPLLIDASSADTLALVGDFAGNFAGTISQNVHIASDDTRRKLHLAATIVNNFSNHLFALTEAYCRQQDVDFKLLIPLIEETAKRTEQFSPAQIQTGPSIRQDTKTLRAHLRLLENFSGLKKIYKIFTKSIQQFK
jgi:predicted short-subunit dehydrogenase-like oxidoreductase (DUF2520 family)